MKIKVLVIGRSDERRAALLGMLHADDIGNAQQVKKRAPALDRVESMDPDVAVILLGEGESDAFALCERIYLSKPRCAVLMVSESLDLDGLQKALAAGATNLVAWPDNAAVLQDAVFAAHTRKNMHLGALNEKRKGGPASKVVTVFGTKGGIGKSTLAVNLAVKLSQMNRKVCLVDLDLQFGDVSVFLDIEAKDTIAELIRDNNSLDIDTIRNYMVLHSSGVHVLCAPNSPEFADIVTGSHVERLINALKPYYDYVIIDTPPMLGECVLTAIECSAQVLFVLGLDISILRNAKICLNLMDSLQQTDKIMMVINREVDGSVTMKDVQRIVNRPIIARFPSDWKLAVSSLNKGVPFVISAPNSGLSRMFTQFAHSFVGAPPQPQKPEKKSKSEVSMGLLERLERQKNVTQHAEAAAPQAAKRAAQPTEDYQDLRAKVHTEVIDVMNKRQSSLNRNQSLQFKEELLHIIETIVDREAGNIPRADKLRVSREICDEVAGLGPLEPLLNNSDVNEIMVNGYDHVYVEKAGRIELSDVHFRDNNHVMNIIDRIVSTVGRRIDESSPMVDARLPDGSRVNAVIPPLSLVGPVITIRKFSRKPFTPQDLIRFGSISQKMMAFLEAGVKGRLNIIVSGGTGSGKTTLLNVLSGFIPEDERIVTIEDAAELQMKQQHVVTLESRPPNIEGKGQITIRDLVRNALRMRPDRIVVGEVRSGETLDMLQAMNTGHDGSITTAHANNSRDLISRLETMVLMAGMELPLRAIREQVASAIDLIVQQTRMRDGSRKITAITEIVGMEGDVITLQDLFVYEQEGMDSNGNFKGRFRATGIRPQFLEKMRNNGVGIRDEWFQN